LIAPGKIPATAENVGYKAYNYALKNLSISVTRTVTAITRMLAKAALLTDGVL
jgi:hypothetical protein